MTGFLIQVCSRPMAFSRAGPRPECQDAPTAVEIGPPELAQRFERRQGAVMPGKEIEECPEVAPISGERMRRITAFILEPCLPLSNLPSQVGRCNGFRRYIRKSRAAPFGIAQSHSNTPPQAYY